MTPCFWGGRAVLRLVVFKVSIVQIQFYQFIINTQFATTSNKTKKSNTLSKFYNLSINLGYVAFGNGLDGPSQASPGPGHVKSSGPKRQQQQPQWQTHKRHTQMNWEFVGVLHIIFSSSPIAEGQTYIETYIYMYVCWWSSWLYNLCV